MTDVTSILIVEDERIVARDIAATLKEMGFKVAGMTGVATEALSLAKSTRPDLVLMDIMLANDADGVELASQIQQAIDRPVVFLTAMGDDEIIQRASQSQPYGFVLKPFSPRALRAAIETALVRHRLEQELLKERQRYRALFDFTNDAILILDLDGRCREANHRAAEMFGYPAKEMVGRPVRDFVAPEEHAAMEQRIASIYAGKEQPVFERLMRRADGTVFPVEINTALVRDHDGRLLQMHGILRDISERKAAEVRLQRTEALLRAVVQDQSELIVRFRPDFTITFANQAFHHVLGYPSEELLGKNLIELTPGRYRPGFLATLRSIGADQPVATNIVPRSNESGELRWLQWTDRAILDNKGQVVEYQSVGRDITEQVAAEEALRESNHKLEAALADLQETQQQMVQQERLAAVGQLAAGIAHDFNNVLAAVILYADLLMTRSSLTEADREKVAAIREQGQRAAELVQQILDFSRRAIMRRQSVDLVEFLVRQTELLRRTLPVGIRLHSDNRLPSLVVSADPTRLQQALLNLVFNARDAMPAGGDLYLELDGSVDDEGQLWGQLCVRDTGEGIEPDVLPYIFEPFFTTKETGQGSGLGLAQVYGILQQHQGRVEVSSEPGQGSSFVMCLPALSSSIPDRAEQTAEPMLCGRGERILVVEDEPLVRAALVASLEDLNYRPRAAADGREALQMVLEREGGEQFDLVVSDILLPSLGGDELCRRIKERFHSIRVLLVSGQRIGDGENQSLGADGYLQKPIDLTKLADAVAAVLGRQGNEEE